MKHTALSNYYEKAFEKVNVVFSGNQFNKELQGLGLPKSILVNTHHSRVDWLSVRCDRMGRRLYSKKQNISPNVNNVKPVVDEKAELQKAIALIKSKGGKVLMPTTQYSEV